MDIRFAEPQWVHLLWVVVAYTLLLAWLESRGEGALERLVSSPLRDRLVTGPSRAQRAARLLFLAMTGVFLTLALMRPQWGMQLIESSRSGAQIMICLDVSRSMLAEDVVPNRLERAKAEIRDLLQMLDGDQVGLIAFAGRAAVLSPLTPDFGFLRLALDEAGPQSVSRGGTRLEEPIRKAVKAFGEEGASARSILLITDGEDHDSFPLEAAQEAAQLGIRILAVGFGDESGSEIPLTNPKTGARGPLTDAEGNVVLSRLDGDLLREMALETDGAYVPAGTGALDLESIFSRHIAPLTRASMDGHTRAVRQDIFQWPVLLALLALFGAVLSTATPRAGRPGGSGTFQLLLLSGWLAAGAALPAGAEPATKTPESPEVTAETGPAEGGGQSETEVAPEDYREAYNQGVARLKAGELEQAERLLGSARERSGGDIEARYRAAYNLGWVEVSLADRLLESDPEQALQHLNRSSEWFREAVALRSDENDARYNLELVMRRALELADSLAASNQKDLGEALESLIAGQRAFLDALQPGVRTQMGQVEPHVGTQMRRDYRASAARQLMIMSDAEQLARQAGLELAALEEKPEEQRSAEDALRAVRLETVLGHLHSARERMGQARSRLRRLQGERAYRRAAAAQGDLQRARDQLLDPVTRLDTLLREGVDVARLTAVKAAGAAKIGGSPPPAWLSNAYLRESLDRIGSRTDELHRELATALAAPATAAPADPNQDQTPPLAEGFGEATPLIGEAVGHFDAAGLELTADRPRTSLARQSEALQQLSAAREKLLDLRRLIDLVHADETRVAAQLASALPAEDPGNPTSQPRAEKTPLATDHGAALHRRNTERTTRLEDLLTEAITEAIEPGTLGASPAQPDEAGSGERERLEQAFELLQQSKRWMRAADQSFANVSGAETDTQTLHSALETTRDSVEHALIGLEALQRLFFNVLEHLQDTARRQQRLADETEALAVLGAQDDEAETGLEAGPLGHRQEQLAETAEAVEQALRAQATASPPEEGAQQPSVPGPAPEQLSQAADLVKDATSAMTRAATDLQVASPALDDSRTAQEDALTALGEAIALLQEPDPPSSDENQQQESSQNPGEEEQQADGTEQEGDDRGDMAQLLQGVRDREAERRWQLARSRERQGYDPVEKDW